MPIATVAVTAIQCVTETNEYSFSNTLVVPAYSQGPRCTGVVGNGELSLPFQLTLNFTYSKDDIWLITYNGQFEGSLTASEVHHGV